MPQPHQLLHELVELGRAHDPCRDRSLQVRLLLRELGGVVAALERVDADDGRHHHPPHAGTVAGLLQVAGGGREEIRGCALVGDGPVATSMIVSTPASASSSPSPVITSTPCEREMGTTS